MGKNIYLYHGSDQEVIDPKCYYGFKGHDFGQCFYGTNYESSISAVMATELYEKLLNDRSLLENGDIYLFSLLEIELRKKGLI